ncbi:MAG: hypothetical protein NT069_10745 [Planctomycetota bacterium]|nr:hypothetical protein [Planctomycetota bacterium]
MRWLKWLIRLFGLARLWLTRPGSIGILGARVGTISPRSAGGRRNRAGLPRYRISHRRLGVRIWVRALRRVGIRVRNLACGFTGAIAGTLWSRRRATSRWLTGDGCRGLRARLRLRLWLGLWHIRTRRGWILSAGALAIRALAIRAITVRPLAVWPFVSRTFRRGAGRWLRLRLRPRLRLRLGLRLLTSWRLWLGAGLRLRTGLRLWLWLLLRLRLRGRSRRLRIPSRALSPATPFLFLGVPDLTYQGDNRERDEQMGDVSLRKHFQTPFARESPDSPVSIVGRDALVRNVYLR